MKYNKAQGMPINVVIVAALALIVLVVLLVIFSGSIGKTAENIGSCTTKNGMCADKLGGKCGGDYPIPLFVSSDCKDSDPKNLCCIRIGSGENQKK